MSPLNDSDARAAVAPASCTRDPVGTATTRAPAATAAAIASRRPDGSSISVPSTSNTTTSIVISGSPGSSGDGVTGSTGDAVCGVDASPVKMVTWVSCS